MMKKFDVVIIGGGVAGLSAGIAVKNKYKNKTVLILREEENNLVPCGIPYIFGKLDGEVDKNVKPLQGYIKAKGDLVIDTVKKVNIEKKSVLTLKNGEFGYDKLIFASGSEPLIPKFIKGYDLENTYYVKKSYTYIKKLAKTVNKVKKIAIIGGGFIGLEMADELAMNTNKEITVIEMQPYCLSMAFSEYFGKKAEQALIKKGVSIRNNTKVMELKETENGTKIIFENNDSMEVDIVIFSLGYRPNTKLATDCGLPINKFGAICTDSLLRTEIKDVFAIGDCAQKNDFITGKNINAMLASIAGAESRIIVENLFSVSSIRNCLGTIKIFSTSINGEVFASAGMIMMEAERENVAAFSAVYDGFDKHPKSIPGTAPVRVNLTIAKNSFQIIGVELYGGNSVGEMINVIGTAIQARLNIHNFYTFQMGTQPLLTGGPTVYPLIKAVEKAIRISDTSN
ncbi:FAD-dependent oxidoreductase [bacterium]|nr:FAD-dependent oxidoreductase [bacterium]